MYDFVFREHLIKYFNIFFCKNFIFNKSKFYVFSSRFGSKTGEQSFVKVRDVPPPPQETKIQMTISITARWVRRKRGLRMRKTQPCHRLGVTTHLQLVWMKPRIWTLKHLNFPCNFTLLHLSPLCQGCITASRLIILLYHLMLSFLHCFGQPSNSTALSWQDLHSVTRNCNPHRIDLLNAGY